MLVPLTPTEQKLQEMEALSKEINDWSEAADKQMHQIAAGEAGPDLPDIDESKFEKVWEILGEIAPETTKYLSEFVEG